MFREPETHMATELRTPDDQQELNPAAARPQNGPASAATETAGPLPVKQAAAFPDQASRGFWPVLKNRSFLILWTGQLFSQLADKVYLVLMIAIISSQFEAPGQTISGWVSAIMIAFTVPAVLLGSIAGVFVDRWRKKPILVITNLARGLLVISLPIMLWSTAGWQGIGGLPVGFLLLLVVTFLVSALTQFFAPAEQAIIPLVVEKPNLLSANSLYTTTMMASVIIGFAVGEPLLALANTFIPPLGLGPEDGQAVLVGLSYAVAGFCLLLLRPGKTPPPPPEGFEHPHIWADIRDGLVYLNQQVQVRGAVIQLVLLSSVFASLAVLAVRLAELIPNLKASQFGFLLAAGGVGMAIGAVFIGQFGQRFSKRYLSLIGSLGMAVTLVLLAWTTQLLWPSLGLIFGLGLCAAAVGIPMQTIIQEKTPESMRGKVFGLQNNLVNIALSLPLALTSLIETTLGLSNVYIGLGLIVGIGGSLTWYIADTASKASKLSSSS